MNRGQRRLCGYHRCEWRVGYSAGDPERHYLRRTRGQQCSFLVSPEIQKKHGVIICAIHFPDFLATLKTVVAKEQERRSHLDPGPVNI